MSMQELPDDQLDQLFRKSAEDWEVPFEPQAWQAMRQKLDEEDDPRAGAVWWEPYKTIGLSVGLLMLAGLAYWCYVARSNTLPKLPQDTSQMVTLPAPSSARARTNATQARSPQKSSKLLSPKPSDTKESATTPNAISEQALIKPSASPAPNLPTNPSDIRSVKRQSTEATRVGKNSIGRNEVSNIPKTVKSPKKRNFTKVSGAVLAVKQNNHKSSTGLAEETTKGKDAVPISTDNKEHLAVFPQRSQTMENIANIDNQSNLVQTHTIPLEPLQSKNWTYLMSQTPPLMNVEYTPTVVGLPKKSNVTPTVFQKGLSVRLASTPDLSYISAAQLSRQLMSMAWGGFLEYRFSKRLSVQVGLIKSLKSYVATGEQYVWPARWNSQVARPISIDADCKVLDLPVNLRYDVWQGRKSRVFLGAGVSSYRMLNEQYAYNYPPHTYNIKWKTWEGATGDYWLGVANGSIGFERQIAKRWSAQIEPFLKVPLAQVGLGQIRLRTTGALVSLRYKVPSLRAKARN